MQIQTFKDKEDAARAAGNALSEKILRAHTSGQKILLMLSGGSAFEILDFIYLSLSGTDFIDSESSSLPAGAQSSAESMAGDITISVLDERFFDQNSDQKSDQSIENNFAQIMQTNFWKHAVAAGCRFIDTRPNGRNMEQLSNEFELALREWREQNPNGQILITQGIGKDGHTSGIMPYPESPKFFTSKFASENWVADYDTGDKNKYPLRITTTSTFLKEQVDFSAVFVCGEDKTETFKKFLTSNDIAENEMPAKIISKMKKVSIFTDIIL